MTSTITDYSRARYTTKAFEPTRRISDADMDKVRDLLRLSPSSTNIQPWHFVIASTEEGKARVAKAAETKFPFNAPLIKAASHVIVFASLLDATEEHLLKVLAQEETDGRFDANPEEFKPQMHGARSMFLNIHKHDMKDAQHWLDKQVYLNLGNFLLGVAALGIDATPMEGVDTQVLDAEFGLREKGFGSLLVVPIGYADTEADYNRSLPKSRLPNAEIITEV
ncbi:oxygen-insensitive NAD(P)H nitroreductase [Roseovarius sp. C7]|uniref:oxygen-insensitive NAD(P)H nitroreductase n=1 Tax=Roseovarius sp. C7 TaxID=3398643 RepID=UPI0039F67C2A